MSRTIRKDVVGWYLYDFANSFLIINGSLYFPQWIVGSTNSVSDFWYNFAFVASSVLLIFAAPLFGYFADKIRLHWISLVWSTIVLNLAGFGVALAPLIADAATRSLLAMLFFFVVILSYQISLVFYNSLLIKLGGREDYARLSGRGFAWGWVGGIIAVLLGLLFTMDILPGFGPLGGMRSLFPSAVLTAMLSLLSLRLMRTTVISFDIPVNIGPAGTSLRDFLRTGILTKGVVAFLACYFLYSDAILTLQNNSTIFMDKVFGFGDTEKGYLFLLVLLTSALGALMVSLFIKRYSLVSVLIAMLATWSAVAILSAFSHSKLEFVIWFGVIGLLNGLIWNVSRTLFTLLTPDSLKNTYFGFYSSFERFASVIGPLVWSGAIVLSGNDPVSGYRNAWLAMGVLLVVSTALSILLRTRLEESIKQIKA